jgi:hypothetical protein
MLHIKQLNVQYNKYCILCITIIVKSIFNLTLTIVITIHVKYIAYHFVKGFKSGSGTLLHETEFNCIAVYMTEMNALVSGEPCYHLDRDLLTACSSASLASKRPLPRTLVDFFCLISSMALDGERNLVVEARVSNRIWGLDFNPFLS